MSPASMKRGCLALPESTKSNKPFIPCHLIIGFVFCASTFLPLSLFLPLYMCLIILIHSALWLELFLGMLTVSSFSYSSYSQTEWNKLVCLSVPFYFSSGYSCQGSLVVLGEVPGTIRCYLARWTSFPMLNHLGQTTVTCFNLQHCILK